MGSQIDVQTDNEYADKESGLSRIYSIDRNCKQLKASKAIQSSLTESDVACNEIEEENVVRNGRPNAVDELLTDFNHSKAMNRRNNYRNIFNKNGSRCGAVCKMDNYKSGAIGVIHANERAKTRANEIAQTSKSVGICQRAAHCSKSMHHHRQARPAYSHQKCSCKELCEQSSRKHRHVNLSTVNAKKARAPPNQMLVSASNYYHKRRCRCVIPASSRNTTIHDVVKCRDCGRYILQKYYNGKTNDVRHYSTCCHLHSNDRNHSEIIHSLRHTHCCKHY